MNILQLKYAVEVQRAGSITKAADNLYMNQPNLSKAIKELEGVLGFALFKRNSKGVAATPQGEEFLVYAKKVIEQMNKLEERFSQREQNKITFKISVPRATYITDAYAQFLCDLDTQKELDFEFLETNSMQAIANLLENDYHLGIIRYPTKFEHNFLKYLAGKDIKHHVIWEFSYLALLNKDDPLAQNTSMKSDLLADYIQLTHGDGSVPSVPSYELRREEEEENPPRVIKLFERGSQFDLLHSVPKTYMWVSPMPQKVLDRLGLCQVACSDVSDTYKDALIYRHGYKLSPQAKDFISKLGQVKNTLLT